MAKRIKEDKIAFLELQLQQVTFRAAEIRERVRAEEATSDPKTAKRREIYNHLQNHLADVAAKYTYRQQEICTTTAQTEELARQQASLEDSVRAVARSIGVTGMTDVTEIEREVLRRAKGLY